MVKCCLEALAVGHPLHKYLLGSLPLYLKFVQAGFNFIPWREDGVQANDLHVAEIICVLCISLHLVYDALSRLGRLFDII
jgi:hypothetical protein